MHDAEELVNDSQGSTAVPCLASVFEVDEDDYACGLPFAIIESDSDGASAIWAFTDNRAAARGIVQALGVLQEELRGER